MKLHSNNKKMISCLLCFSVLSGSLFFPADPYSSAATPSSGGPHILSYVCTGQNDDLTRYQYIDDQGHPVSLHSFRKSSSSRKKAANLPSSYDSRDYNLVTPIKDQGISGSCWAFAALKALESSSICQGLTTLEQTDYSENHLAWYAYHPVTQETDPLYGDGTSPLPPGENAYDFGGNIMTSLFVLANWWGAVHENESPFTADTKEDFASMINTMSQKGEDFRNLSELHLKESNCYDNASLEEKKQAVMDYGALDVSLYYDNDTVYETGDITSIYQTDYDISDANHSAAIIGWDDDFDEFGTPDAPKGAWLVANSYGDYNGMGGCFWVSYDDSSLCEFYSLEGEDTDTYDTNFQYDGNGWGEVIFESSPITVANVFTNNSDSPKSIDAVTFYTVCDNQDYEVQIYRRQSGASPTNGDKISNCSTEGRIKYSGYHTVPLSQPVIVAPGESFSVLLTYQVNPFADGNTYVPVEGVSNTYSDCKFHSRTGQSYILIGSEGIWYDQTSVKIDDTALNLNNACIKALAHTSTEEEYEEQEKQYALMTSSPVPTDTSFPSTPPSPAASLPALISFPPAGVQPIPSAASPSLSPDSDKQQSLTVTSSKIRIGKKEKVSFPFKDKSLLKNSRVTYQSSAKNIATVNKNGKITGQKTGQAKITAMTETGVKKTITISIRKAPKNVRLTARKSVLKKGQTTLIKTRLSRGSASYLLKFSSSSPAVAKVNQKGRIHAIKRGTAWITVRCYNGKRGRIKIHVL